MLTELRIRNFAIIESVVLPLASGFNVLSGETGAGKSIIVGALGLLLGERASSDLVRTGADRATVEGVFELEPDDRLIAHLDERGIDAEDRIVVLKREISSAGRTRAWINGSTVTAGVLAEIGRTLVNLHGQHEAQTLLDGEAQRAMLDEFGGAAEEAAGVRAAHEALRAVRAEIDSLAARKADAERRADYLRHVVKEIDDARLTPGEEARLEEDARRLEHAEELRALAAEIACAIEGSGGDVDSVLSGLGALQRPLASIQRIDPALERLQELYDTAYYALEELTRAAGDYAQRVDLDPDRLDEVRRRRDLLFRLTKKYGATAADVIELGRQSRAELDLVDTASLDLRQLEQRAAEAADELRRRAARLTELRTAAADRLARTVDEVLPDVGMPDGRLSILLQPTEAIGPSGAEDVEFRVALNVGHDARPLARVASGGELSRVMLALKTILARLDQVPTLVFDEVDAGIGGRVALQVGDTLRSLASHHQVFAITHLPQLAARAHHHIAVAKGARGGVTTADIAVLTGDQRVEEIARMLGGDAESDLSRAHARELLETAVTATGRSEPPRRSRRKA